MSRRMLRRTGALLAAGLLATAGCSPAQTGSSDPTDKLEVLSWWTSGSEQQALAVLFDAYTAQHGGVTITNATVAGGGGSNAQVVLAQRLIAGNPPDVYQTFPAGSLRAYVAQGQMADVSGVLEDSGMATHLPKVIMEGLTIGGRQYGVPTSSHRGNVLFYNKSLLAKAEVAEPSADYTLDQLLADTGKLEDAGVVPLCLGAKDPFTTAALFENVLLSTVGTQGWQQITADRFDWTGDQVRSALKTFGTLLDRADPQAAALSWDQATGKLAKGECAFETINDSAYGELITAGATDGSTFGELPFPGTASSYVAVVDTFVRSSKAVNGRNAADFLSVIGEPEVQTAFSKIKGSVPVRTDADVSSLSAYQRAAATALRDGTVLWSITHGEAMSPQFQQGYYDAVASYVRSRDPRAFTDTLQQAMSRQAPAK